MQNEKVIELNFSEEKVNEIDQFSINPIIYFRVAKPFKKEAKLPQFDLTKYYNTIKDTSLAIEIVPDINQQKNHQLIKGTQEKWDKVVANDPKFDEEAKREFLQTIDQ